MTEMLDVKCCSCGISMGKSPHNFNIKVLFCFNCADLRERGIE
jgi:hypothetical protein